MPGKFEERGLPWTVYFARFHGGEREYRAVQRRSKLPSLDLLKNIT